MKTTILVVAITLGTFACVNAGTPKQEMNANNNVETVAVVDEAAAVGEVAQAQDEYVDVKLESLNAKVQAAINAYQEAYSTKSLAFNAAKNLTKVTLVSKADQSEKEVILDEEGKEV